MKITRSELKKLILQELLDVTSVPGHQQSQVDMQFRTGPFTNLISVTSDTLDRLEDVIRDSGDLKKQDLEGLKNNELQKLMDKIGFITATIDAKIQGKAVHSNAEGYE